MSSCRTFSHFTELFSFAKSFRWCHWNIIGGRTQVLQYSLFCAANSLGNIWEKLFIISSQHDVIRKNHICNLSASRALDESAKWDDMSCPSIWCFLLFSTIIFKFVHILCYVVSGHARIFSGNLTYLWVLMVFGLQSHLLLSFSFI